MRQPAGGRKGLLATLALVAVVLLLTSSPVVAKRYNPHRQHRKYDPELLQSVVGFCDVATSAATCQGGYNSTSTFTGTVAAGDVVTLSMTYEDNGGASPALGFSDSMGVNVTVVVQSCAPTNPVICSAVGYFVPSSTGLVVVTFEVQGGTTGCIHFTAQDWFANNSGSLQHAGTSGYCTACTGNLTLAPVTLGTLPSEVIAVGQTQAFFSTDPTGISPSLPFFYSHYSVCDGSIYGDLVTWQATDGNATSYDFAATVTGAAPVVFAGAAAVLYV
ncbi:MAG: hypothetical protein JRN57_03810 [Nitrososphaerota archaeon]|nr:hypothetical protein [Nitrososphaerota archaeon]